MCVRAPHNRPHRARPGARCPVRLAYLPSRDAERAVQGKATRRCCAFKHHQSGFAPSPCRTKLQLAIFRRRVFRSPPTGDWQTSGWTEKAVRQRKPSGFRSPFICANHNRRNGSHYSPISCNGVHYNIYKQASRPTILRLPDELPDVKLSRRGRWRPYVACLLASQQNKHMGRSRDASSLSVTARVFESGQNRPTNHPKPIGESSGDSPCGSPALLPVPHVLKFQSRNSVQVISELLI